MQQTPALVFTVIELYMISRQAVLLFYIGNYIAYLAAVRFRAHHYDMYFATYGVNHNPPVRAVGATCIVCHVVLAAGVTSCSQTCGCHSRSNPVWVVVEGLHQIVSGLDLLKILRDLGYRK